MRQKHEEIVLLAITKLNAIEIVIFKALIESDISHHEFVLGNDELKEHYDIKKQVKAPKCCNLDNVLISLI